MDEAGRRAISEARKRYFDADLALRERQRRVAENSRQLQQSGGLRSCVKCGMTARYTAIGKHERRCFTTLDQFYEVIAELQVTRRDDTTGCLIWLDQYTGDERKTKRPRVNGKLVTVRLAEIALGRPLLGYPVEVVCHSCDRDMCVEPCHLWIGTQRQNVRDMMLKERGRNQFTDTPYGYRFDPDSKGW